MSHYRDEMSAALARAQAAEKNNELLERECADQQRQLEEQREQLEQQQREIADLRRKAGIKAAADEAEKQARSKRSAEAPRSRGKLGRLLAEHKLMIITVLVSCLLVGGPLLGMYIHDLRTPYSSSGDYYDDLYDRWGRDAPKTISKDWDRGMRHDCDPSAFHTR